MEDEKNTCSAMVCNYVTIEDENHIEDTTIHTADVYTAKEKINFSFESVPRVQLGK